MDKQAIIASFKHLASDRTLLTLLISLIVSTVVYSLIIGFSIQASDVTVYTRYSAFGEAHFYKSHWQYLLTFIIFGVVVLVGHASLMAKLHDMGRRQTAMVVAWAGIALLLIACMYATGVMSLGRAA